MVGGVRCGWGGGAWSIEIEERRWSLSLDCGCGFGEVLFCPVLDMLILSFTSSMCMFTRADRLRSFLYKLNLYSLELGLFGK